MTDNPGQQALVESAHVKFAGMSLDALDTPPSIDDRMQFLVTAKCIGSSMERRKDGELRKTMKMEVEDVVVHGDIQKPEKDPELELEYDAGDQAADGEPEDSE
jgi:hypothetical protein